MEECPICNNDNAYYDGVKFICPDCGNEWEWEDNPDREYKELLCPHCGSDEVSIDTSGYDYICDSCGHRWDKEDEDDWDEE